MSQGRKRYDKQFKSSAAKVVLSGEMAVKGLSEKLGVKGSMMGRWAYEYKKTREVAFSGNGSSKVNKDYEVVKLKKKIEEFELKTEILEGKGMESMFQTLCIDDTDHTYRTGQGILTPSVGIEMLGRSRVSNYVPSA